jgi:hypothetical protein
MALLSLAVAEGVYIHSLQDKLRQLTQAPVAELFLGPDGELSDTPPAPPKPQEYGEVRIYPPESEVCGFFSICTVKI